MWPKKKRGRQREESWALSRFGAEWWGGDGKVEFRSPELDTLVIGQSVELLEAQKMHRPLLSAGS